MDGAVYHEFNCERLYEELLNYKQYLEDCKEDSINDDEDIKTIEEQLGHTQYMISALEEIHDCMQ